MWGFSIGCICNDCGVYFIINHRSLAIGVDSGDSSYTPHKVMVEGGSNLAQMSVLSNVSDFCSKSNCTLLFWDVGEPMTHREADN